MTLHGRRRFTKLPGMIVVSVLSVVPGEIADSVADLDLEAFDLILVDDSKSSAQRAATIRDDCESSSATSLDRDTRL